MKMLSVRKRFLGIAALFAMIMPDVLAVEYITDIAVSSHEKKRDSALGSLKDNGYKYDGWDMNGGAGGWYSFVGYKTSTSSTNAITNLVLLRNPSKDCRQGVKLSDNRTYYQAETYGESDLNRGAGGDWLYLYYTREGSEFGCLTALNPQTGNAPLNAIPVVDDCYTIGDAADFNSGTGKMRIYYGMTKSVVPGTKLPKLTNELKAVDLGGGLYQLTVPLGCIDDGGKDQVLGFKNVGAVSLYMTSEKGSEEKIAILQNVNSSDVDYKSKWKFALQTHLHPNVKNSNVITLSRTDLSDLTETGYTSEYAYEGNDTDMRLVSLFFRVKDNSIKIKKFRCAGTVSTSRSGNSNINLDFSCAVNAPVVPEGINNITVVDPILDFTASKQGSGQELGNQQVNVVTAGKMKKAGIWDIDKGGFKYFGPVGDETSQLSYNFPSTNDVQNYNVLLFGEYKSITDNGMSVVDGVFSVPLSIKPYHSIKSMSVTAQKHINDKGEFVQQNKVVWTVDNVRCEDVMPVDEYLVQRASSANFSDAVTIGSVSVSDLDTAFVKVKLLSDTKDIGTYTYIDDIEGCSYNRQNKDVEAKLYYRVVRATVFANWGGDNMGIYGKVDSLQLDNILARVGAISVEKTGNFDDEKLVKVRVELPALNGKSWHETIKRDPINNPDDYDYLYSQRVSLTECKDPVYLFSRSAKMFVANKEDSDDLTLADFYDTTTSLAAIRLVKNADGTYWINSADASYSQYMLTDRSILPMIAVWGKNKNAIGSNLIIDGSDLKYNIYSYDGSGDKYYYLDHVWSFLSDRVLGLFWNLRMLPKPNSEEWIFLPIKEELMIYDDDGYMWSSDATVTIKRYSPDSEHYEGRDYAAKTITVQGSDVKWDSEKQVWYAEVEDIQSAPYIHYYYSATVDNSRSLYPIEKNEAVATTEEEANACYSETIAPISHLEASMGTIKGKVAVEWEVDEGLLTGFRLEKREVVLSKFEEIKYRREYVDAAEEGVWTDGTTYTAYSKGALISRDWSIDANNDLWVAGAISSLKELKMHFVPTGEVIEYRDGAIYPIYYIAGKAFTGQELYIGKYSPETDLTTGGSRKLKLNAMTKEEAVKFIVDIRNEGDVNVMPLESGRPTGLKIGVERSTISKDEYLALIPSGNTSSVTVFSDATLFGRHPAERMTLASRKPLFDKISTNPADQKEYEKLTLASDLATTYVDGEASSGTLYEYKLTALCSIYGKTYEVSKSTYGWNPYYGTLRGKIQLKNGAAMPGSVSVKVSSQQDVTVGMVAGKSASDVLIPGHEGRYEAELVTTDGTFELDSVPYLSAGTDYDITVSAQGASFVVAGMGNTKTFTTTLDDKMYDKTVTFVCEDTHQFSGRVLYEQSTIPVRGCQFLMNGSLVLDSNGQPVTTDNKGNFSFILPAIDMTLQAYKPGHKFADGGYVIGRNSEQLEVKPEGLPAGLPEGACFRPAADYDGLILSDQTKVRLVGRLTGGNVQGSKPIGYGLSKNNLGDNLRLVLELEGDNTAQIVYDNENPDNTTRDEELAQTVEVSSGSETQTMECAPTKASFQKKRIIVEPDVATGEFCLDLPPTKYKITELSATGYATLFNEGEGFQILDLSNDTTLIDGQHEILNDKGNVESICRTRYNSLYQRVVHNPVTISYSQYQYGLKKDFLGSEKMTELNLLGERKTAIVASYDKSTKKAVYMFGSPVYEQGKEYQLKVEAHEDYYYNGDTHSEPDKVNIEGGKLKVRNELVSSVSTTEYKLDKNGTAMFSFVAANPEFTVEKKDALRYLTMQVETNGYYYESEPIKAYVTGIRDKGKDVMTLDGRINVVDVVRDPYGSKSFAYREAGTHYNWNYYFKVDVGVGLDISLKMGANTEWFTGVWAGVGSGAVAGVPGSTNTAATLSLNVPIFNLNYADMATYDMTLNTRIQTSDDPRDVGAMADVYVGFVETYNVSRAESFSLIDSATYEIVRPAVESGAIRIMQEGRDADSAKYYLAISEKLKLGLGKERQFVYTQKHILGTVIPQLAQQYEAMILRGTRSEIQAMANTKCEILYRLKEGKEISDDDCYETIYPLDGDGNVLQSAPPTAVSPENCEQAIKQWMQIVAENEQKKLDLITSGKPHDSYSISASTKIEHTEAAESFCLKDYVTVAVGGVTVTNGDNQGEWRSKITENLSGSITKLLSKMFGDIFSGKKTSKEHSSSYAVEDKDGNTKEFTTVAKVPGANWSFNFVPSLPFNMDRSKTNRTYKTGGSGYTLETNDNSYLDIDVYRADQYNVDLFSDEQWNTMAGNPNSEKVADGKVQDFVFTARGGAERQPWHAPDSTIFYNPGTPLTTRTLRIDNPKISISNPVVSNLPTNEKAVFSVRLTNDTEVTSNMNTGAIKVSSFVLYLDDFSTPDGAAILMDGMPITDGRVFCLQPGESVTKTIQVERCGKAYDYENIRLVFADAAMSLFDEASLSVHYLPSSTPVRLTRPVDKWVMNTLSAKDDYDRYYLPVEITGFDINYDNFDHIELQYKKKTEGDSKWVNLCSYYANDTLYAQASGEKGKIKSGTITHRFYGEMDPVEMEYDIRAISFCRLGSGYVSQASNVVSGLKDTRIPEVFGKPKPTNGILTYADVVSIPFNEPIAYNYLDETSNFMVTGFTNNSERSYQTSLHFPTASEIPDWNIPDPDDKSAYEEYVSKLEQGFREWLNVPSSLVKRNLTGRDFTIDAMVKMENNSDNALFFVVMDKNQMRTQQAEQYMLFGTTSGRLYALFNGMRFISEPFNAPRYANDKITLTSDLTQVAMTFRQAGNVADGEPQVRFFVDGVEILLDKITDSQNQPVTDDVEVICNAYGEISIGSLFSGNMTDLRLWDKALTLSELNARRGKMLTGTEPGLMGYWPIDEMSGNVLFDKANGADLHFSRQTWHMPEGQHSLRLDGEGIELQNVEEFLRNDFDDYTLSLWINPDVNMNTSRSDGVTVFQSGGNLNADKFRIYLSDHALSLQSGSKTFNFCSRESVMDGGWHNLVVVANKSQNIAALYLDGSQVQILSGDDLKGMFDQVTLGGEGFYGNLDVLTFWHLAFPTNNLNLIHNMSPMGVEMGLVYYLPFEMDERNSQNTWQSVFCPYNEVKKYKADGTEAARKLAILPKNGSYTGYDDTKSFPAVKTLTGLTNLPFSWTSTDNELQINIKKNDSEINHQQLFVTVRGVEDLAGNTLANPQMMMVYVDRNVLVWDKKSQEIKVPYGNGATVRVAWQNKSGRTISYHIENNNTWLTLSNTMGVAQPLCQETVDIEISDGLAPGEYTATIYMIDENQLSSAMTLNVLVEASEPAMEVISDPSYRYSMNIMGRVKIKNEGGIEYFDMDRRDIVFAIYNGICIGKSYLTVDNERNSSMVNMTIYGSDKMIEEASLGKQEIGFVLWRASTNEISILQNDGKLSMSFVNNGMVGCPPGEPVIFTLNNDFKQLVPLETGWNWISFNVNPKSDRGLNNLFESNSTFSIGDRIYFKGVASELIQDYFGGFTWSGNHDTIDNHEKRVYQLYVQKPCYATVFGTAYTESERYVNIKASAVNDGNGCWNDLPYLLSVDQPINVAMSDMAKDRAQVGSVIKSRKQFAVMGNSGEWIGSLQYMHPGEGYYMRYLGTENVDVKYTNTQVSKKSETIRLAEAMLTGEETVDGTADLVLRQGGQYPTSMPVIARVADSETMQGGDMIVAYAEGELAGIEDRAVAYEGSQLYFISLSAEQGSVVRFAHVRNGKVIALSTNALQYDGNGVAGSLTEPFVIEFAEQEYDGDTYDLSGVKMTERTLRGYRGVLIVNGKIKLKK